MLLTPDTDSLRKAQQRLAHLSEHDPDQLYVLSLQIFFDVGMPPDLKTLVLVYIKNCAKFSLFNDQKIFYFRLRPDHQKLFRLQLLDMLTDSTLSTALALDLATTVGNLAAKVIAGDAQTGWPGRINWVMQTVRLDSTHATCVGLRVLNGLVSECVACFVRNEDKLPRLLRTGLASDDADVMCESLAIVASLVNRRETGDVPEVDDWSSECLGVAARIYDMREYCKLDSVFEQIHGVCDKTPAFFEDDFAELLELVWQVQSAPDDDPDCEFKHVAASAWWCWSSDFPRSSPRVTKLESKLSRNKPQKPTDWAAWSS